MLTLADAAHVAQHALKRGRQAERNVENSLSLPHKVLHTNGFRLSVHFYIILPATLKCLFLKGFKIGVCCPVERTLLDTSPIGKNYTHPERTPYSD